MAEKTLVEKVINKEFIYEGSTLAYRKTGQGPCVLLLHGFGEDGTVFNSIIDQLEQHASILIPDIPGSGKSDLPKASSFTIDSLAHAMKAMLDQEQVSSCIILGHSMGGYIALAMAEFYPQLLRGMGLIHSTAYADSAERIKKREQAMALIKTNGAIAFLRLSLPGLFALKFRENHPEIIKNLIGSSQSFSAEALIGYYRAMILRPDRTHILKNLSFPALLVIGDQDELIPAQDVLLQSSLLQQPVLRRIAKAGHMSMLETPDELLAIIRDYILSVSATTV
ncbi:MAG: alpha/beta fold hydrolase [Sediminibacterium sp.]